MTTPEFSRLVDVRHINEAATQLVASEAECAALAQRFALVSVKRLEASLSLEKDGSTITVTGTVVGDIIQSCAVSGEDLAVAIAEPMSLRFVPENTAIKPDEEIELEADELDELEYTGTQIDLGEAVAQSLALAIDPYLTGPQAEEARRKAGLNNQTASGPFAALAALKKKD